MIGIHTYTRTHTTDSLVMVWAFCSLCIWAMSNAKTQCSSWQIFICFFFLLSNFTKKWAFKIKALHCWCGAHTHTRCDINIIVNSYFSSSHLYHLISRLTELRVFVFIFIELSISIVLFLCTPCATFPHIYRRQRVPFYVCAAPH